MQVLRLNLDKHQGMKGHKQKMFTYFLTNIFARTERELKRHCKIKDNNLSFELMGF